MDAVEQAHGKFQDELGRSRRRQQRLEQDDRFGAFRKRLEPARQETLSGNGRLARADWLRLGREFAEAWKRRASPEDRSKLLNSQPALPPELDRDLLHYAVRQSGHRILEEEDRKALRQGFQDGVRGGGEGAL